MATSVTFNPLTGKFDLILSATAAVQTFLTTPSSANLAAAVTDETGSGLLVFGTDPTLASTVTIGTPTGTTGAALFRGTTSGVVTLSVADAAGTWTLKLPTDDGDAGEFLQTDGSGNTTWAAGGAGITIGATTITGGTTTRILYDNAGVVDEYTLTGTGTVVVMQTAPSLTGPVIVNEAVGSSGLTLTGATQTADFPVLSATQTWSNAGVTFTGIKFVVTNTNSAAASKLLEMFVGAATTFAVRKDGRVDIPTNGGIGYSILVSGQNPVGFGRNDSIGGLNIHGGGATVPAAANATMNVAGSNGIAPLVTFDSGTTVGWASTNVTQPVDVKLLRDAANTLALRNATTAQKLRIYNTFTTVDTAGEWFAIDWITTANVCNLQAVKGSSTGTARVLNISYGGAQASPIAAISIPITSGAITFGGSLTTPGVNALIASGTAIPAGGTAGTGYTFSSTANFGVFFGSAAPSLAAAKESLYLRSDGTTTNDRAYINTDGGTTWTALTTVA